MEWMVKDMEWNNKVIQENEKLIADLKKQIKALQKANKEMAAENTSLQNLMILNQSKSKKECCLCGNTKARELEQTTLYSDEDGNDCEEIKWMCKESKGCNN